MGQIRLENLSKSFKGTPVIRDVLLTVEQGEFCVFVGPSGCGKSTLLRLIAGLEVATSGRIVIDGQDVTGLEPYDRGLSMVFQSYALYPHMTVRDNIAFALRTARLPEPAIAAKVAEAARMLQLEPYLDRRPSALSGGQRQRVAIGRAVVREPKAFLFDEPLSNLDAALRSDTRLEIARLHRDLGATMVYVTHDQIEAMTLADRIVVLNEGRIQQEGSPRDLYETPQNLFVAQFIGSPRMNVIPCGTEGVMVRPAGGAPFDPGGPLAAPAVHLGLRPEHLTLTAPEAGRMAGRVAEIEYLGSDLSLFVDAGAAGRIIVRAPGHLRVTPDQTVGLGFSPALAHLFDAQGHRVGP
jgi:multiple sugar transport system ATP-binding protein